MTSRGHLGWHGSGRGGALLAVALVAACGESRAPHRVDVRGYCQAVREVAEGRFDAAARTRARAAHGKMSTGSAEELLAGQREVHGLMINYRVTWEFAAADGVCANAVCPQWLDPMLMVGKGDVGAGIAQAQALLAALGGSGECANRVEPPPATFCQGTLRGLLHSQATKASLIAEVVATRDGTPQDNPVGRYGLTEMVVGMEREARLAVAYSAAVVDACVPPALRPACHQRLAAPGDDGAALAAKLSAIDYAIKGDPCGGGP